ncbi:hypothetical protein KV708_19170 [Comamonas thiooxydans]|uniref:hypothetical protein n=1 Tax=Comamonas thiooxydans TaxID=363952 RepID=UPI000709799F|nr:hypothetical protein [Comamonas thiooxydans]
MTEIEELKARIESLETQSKGLEFAISRLTIAICANGNIDIRSVENDFRKIAEATQSMFTPEDNEDFFVPTERLLVMLDTAAKTIEEALERDAAK